MYGDSCRPSGELLTLSSICPRRKHRLPNSVGVICIQISQRQLQELLLVLPGDLALRKLLAVCRRRRRIGDLRNEVRCRRLRYAIDEDPEQWNLEKDVEAGAEAEEDPFAVTEPVVLLLGGEFDAGEVGFEL